MREHDHVDFPQEGVKFHMTAQEIEFFLTTLTRVHTALIDRVKDVTLSKESRKSDYEFALNTENLYASIFRQLKLYRPERKDLH